MVSIRHYRKIPFVRERKDEKITQRRKIRKILKGKKYENTKNAGRLRETEYFQNQNSHIEKNYNNYCVEHSSIIFSN